MELSQWLKKNQEENFLYISGVSFYEQKDPKPYMLCLPWSDTAADRSYNIIQYYIGGKWVSLQLPISLLKIINTMQSLRWSPKKGSYLVLNLNKMNVETIRIQGESCKIRSWLYRCSRRNYKRYAVNQEE